MNKLRSFLNIYPLVPVALCLVVGIMLGEQLQHEDYWITAAIMSVVTAFVVRQHHRLQSSSILLGFCFVGAFLASSRQRAMNIGLPKETTTYSAIVISEAKEHAKTWSADAVVISGQMKGKTIKAFFSKKHISKPLPTLQFTTTSLLTAPVSDKNSRFNYALYLRRHGIYATTFISPQQYHPKGYDTEGLSFLNTATAKLRLMRCNLIKRIHNWGMSDDAEALVGGIALGNKDNIDSKLRESYSQAGAAHILALSGLHLGIIWAFFSIFCIGRWKNTVTLISLFTIWAYVVFVGLPASAIRSAVMLTICSMAEMTGRKGCSVNALAVAAITILIFAPTAIYDVGFQLSFSAVTFIVTFTKPLTDILPMPWQQSHRVVSKVWQMAVVSFVANIGTLPLVAYYWGAIPIYGVAASCIAIPLVTIILWTFISCLLLTQLSFLPAIINNTAIWALDTSAGCLNNFVTFTASLPYSVINGINISAPQIAIIYIAVTTLLYMSVRYICVKNHLTYKN